MAKVDKSDALAALRQVQATLKKATGSAIVPTTRARIALDHLSGGDREHMLTIWDSDARDFCEALFDWSAGANLAAQKEDLLQSEDRTLAELDLDAIVDDDERKRMARRVKKAQRRLAAAERLAKEPAASKVNKNVLRAVGRALDQPDAVAYAKTADILGLASTFSGFLTPEGIIRIVELVHDETIVSAYAPASEMVATVLNLDTIIYDLPEDHRCDLLIDLTKVSHHGRWSDYTAGRTSATRRAHVGHIEAPFAQVPGDLQRLKDSTVIKRVLNGELNYNTTGIITRLQNVGTIEPVLVAQIYTASHNAHIDPDLAALLSYLPLRSTHLPPTPVPQMINILSHDIGVMREAGNDMLLDQIRQSRVWAEWHPDPDLEMYPYPAYIYRTHGMRIQDHADNNGEIVVEIVNCPAALHANKEYMGNCTYTYNQQCKNGTYVLWRLHYRGNIYNAAITSDNRGANNHWREREINSRHNGGNVPESVRAVWRELIARVNQAAAQEA